MGLAQRLKIETAQTHEAMHVLMGALAPFSDRERYVRFVAAQYLFQERVRQVADQPQVRAWISDLDHRGRTDAARADLDDLSEQLGSQMHGELEPLAHASAHAPVPDAAHGLGWLYVSEGSTLGAAFLFKAAQQELGLSETFGARNLAAAPEGRMKAWRAFVSELDAAGLSPGQADRAVEGAHAAFDFFEQTLRCMFHDLPLPAPTGAGVLQDVPSQAR